MLRNNECNNCEAHKTRNIFLMTTEYLNPIYYKRQRRPRKIGININFIMKFNSYIYFPFRAYNLCYRNNSSIKHLIYKVIVKKVTRGDVCELQIRQTSMTYSLLHNCQISFMSTVKYNSNLYALCFIYLDKSFSCCIQYFKLNVNCCLYNTNLITFLLKIPNPLLKPNIVN